MANTAGMTEVKIYDPAAVDERYGVRPGSSPTSSGSRATPPTTSPACPGIGEKTAASCSQQFGDLEEVLANIERAGGPKRHQLLREHARTRGCRRTAGLA